MHNQLDGAHTATSGAAKSAPPGLLGGIAPSGAELAPSLSPLLHEAGHEPEPEGE